MTVEELRKLVESKRNPVVINRGVTPLSLLVVAFIVLKVMGYITWSWVWVLAPFWIPLCLTLLIVVALLIIMAIITRGLVIEDSKKVATATATETPSESKEETTEEVKEKKPRRKSKKNVDGETNTRDPKEKND